MRVAPSAVCLQALARIDPNSQAGVRTRSSTPKLIVEALPSFVESVRRKAFHVDRLFWSPASVARICKYIAKGFECAVPGVRRAAFGEPKQEPKKEYQHQAFLLRQMGEPYVPPTITLVELTDAEKDANDKRVLETREIGYHGDRKGIVTLFDAEAEVLRSRAYEPKKGTCEDFVDMIEGRLELVEAATIASKIARKLGHGVDPKWVDPPRRERDYYDDEGWYSDDMGGYGFCRSSGKHTNSYGFIREPFRCDVAVRIGDARRDMPLSTNFWAFTDAGRFQPTKALVEDLYNPEKLQLLAEAEATARSEAMAGIDEEELDAALLEFDQGCLFDLYESAGGAFRLIVEREIMRDADSDEDDEQEEEEEDDEADDAMGDDEKVEAPPPKSLTPSEAEKENATV